MAESNRSVKKRKDGTKVITKTNRKGATVKKVMSAKGEDGKRTRLERTRIRTKKSGATVKKRASDGSKTVSRTNKSGTKVRTNKAADGTRSVTRKAKGKAATTRTMNAKGKITGVTKTRKDGSTKTLSSARVKKITQRRNARRAARQGSN